jgi:hypothetical protein
MAAAKVLSAPEPEDDVRARSTLLYIHKRLVSTASFGPGMEIWFEGSTTEELKVSDAVSARAGAHSHQGRAVTRTRRRNYRLSWTSRATS